MNVVDKFAWTSLDSGEGTGTVFVLGNLPEDAKFIPNPPAQSLDFMSVWRYWYNEPANTWLLKPDARPVTVPTDFNAWDGSERYEVDPSDPLRNTWVLKPDAEPVVATTD